MPHDRDARVVLDVADEAVAPTWDDQVDVLVQLKECGDLCSGLDGLDVVG